MTILTIEIPDSETRFVTEFLEKIGGKVKKTEEVKEEESPYDPEFVNKIRKGDEDIRNGNCVKIAIEDLWK